ncbi:MAG: MBL fold metallo-hydrolase [Oligoflexales bacterium]|nr:MBL fold metallo-hydrolase [Oligoflexales bacterium]
MQIKTFFDPDTFTLTYVVFDSSTKDAVVIDPVLNFDPKSGAVTQRSNNELKDFIDRNSLKVHYLLETHAHADHMSGSHDLKKLHFPKAKIAIGKNITLVQETFKKFFNLNDLQTDGSQFDELFSDDQVVKAGSLSFKVLFTPGHTPACVCYLFNDAVFTGDALFMPDFGTGRCDFPLGSSHDLFTSVSKRLYTLPDSTKVFVGHDYQPGGRKLEFETTIATEKSKNIQLNAKTSEAEFVRFRSERDKTLAAPVLLLPSIQVNIAAGEFPAPESNGVSYLKLPLRRT